MNKIGQFVLPVLLFAFVGTAQAAQQTITFGPGGSDFFATDNWEVYYIDASRELFDNSGYRSMAEITGNPWVATTWFEISPVYFGSSSGELFSLDALWLSGAWGSQTLTVTGYLNGVEVYTEAVKVNTTAQLYDFNSFQDIDRFSVSFGNDFVRDPLVSESGLNWAIGSVTITAVPEPETYAMLLAGLGLVGVMARRRRRS